MTTQWGWRAVQAAHADRQRFSVQKEFAVRVRQSLVDIARIRHKPWPCDLPADVRGLAAETLEGVRQLDFDRQRQHRQGNHPTLGQKRREQLRTYSSARSGGDGVDQIWVG